MSTEQNKAIVRRVFTEIFNDGRLEYAEELYAPDCTFHGLPAGFEARTGPSVVVDLCRIYATAFPDQRYTVEELIAERDMVAARWRVQGTHQNTFELGPLNVLRTGRGIDVCGFSMCRVEDGLITEVWQLANMMKAFEQMGAELTATPDQAG